MTITQAILVPSKKSSKINEIVEITTPTHEQLKIYFRRTIRVPANNDVSMLPPGMGLPTLLCSRLRENASYRDGSQRWHFLAHVPQVLASCINEA